MPHWPQDFHSHDPQLNNPPRESRHDINRQIVRLIGHHIFTVMIISRTTLRKNHIMTKKKKNWQITRLTGRNILQA